MGFKFRKSIKVLPGVKVNLSKSGVSTTVGAKGLSVNLNKKGTYLNMGIPGTGIYDRKKISSDNKVYLEKDPTSNDGVSMGLFRKILLYIQRGIAVFFLLIFFITLSEGDIWFSIFILFLVILIDLYDFKLLKNKIFDRGNLDTYIIEDEVTDNSEEYTISDDSEDDYNILKCENGEKLDIQRDNNYFDISEKEKQKLYDVYGELSIEFEDLKQNGNSSSMIDFENKIHKYFSDDVLPLFLKLNLIEDHEPVKEKIDYDDRDFNTYDYIGKTIDKETFIKFIDILHKRLQYYKQGTSDYIYDLYAKSLRRVGNYYKQNKLWKEALTIFNIIEDMGQAGIMDKKSLIKIRNELKKL